jgi:hypothetical protein
MEKWGLIDDCANWLRPGDIEAGRTELKSRITALQDYFDLQYTRWQWVKVATFALSVASAGYAALNIAIEGFAESSFEIAWAATGFAAAAVTWNLPSIMQQLPRSWGYLSALDDEALQPLRNYLRQLADSDRRIVTEKGATIDHAILKSYCALLYLTEIDELYELPMLVSKGIRVKNYTDRLLVERPPLPPVCVRDDRLQQLHFHIDNRSIAITVNQQVDTTEVHNHFEFVTRLREDVASVPPRNAQSPEFGATNHDVQRRWPCRFESDDYEIRLLIFRTEVLAKLKQVKSHQFQKYVAAIDGARKHWQEDPTLNIDELANKLGPIVAKSSNGHSGLNKSASVAWIRSLIGGHGKYAFVKESFEAIQYDPEQYQAVQYRMLSE